MTPRPGGMASVVHHRAQGRDIGLDRRGCVDMGDEHGLVVGLRAQGVGNLRPVGGDGAAKVQKVNLDAEAAHRIGPAMAKGAGGEHKGAVAA